jgi:hypothetical protein
MTLSVMIVIGACILVAFGVLLLLFRRGDLARLDALPGERVICEEGGVGVDEERIRHYRYGSCVVRLTDRRIIIAQKAPLFREKYYVRFAIEYGAPEPGINIGGMLARGYVPARVARSQVGISTEGAAVNVSISLLHANGNRYSDLSYRSERAGEYSRSFK